MAITELYTLKKLTGKHKGKYITRSLGDFTENLSEACLYHNADKAASIADATEEVVPLKTILEEIHGT